MDSGAGTILGQGRQVQERQSLEREIRFFAEIGLFSVPKTSVLQKKGLRQIWSVFLTQKQAFSKKKGFRRIWSDYLTQIKRYLKKTKKKLRLIRSVFLSQNWPRIQV